MIPTLISRARRGIGLTQRDAAARVGVTPQTWHLYDSGKLEPSALKTRQFLRGLALGEEGDNEPEPLYVIGFHLGGFRLLADESGAIVSLPSPQHADWVCDLLTEPPLADLDLLPSIVPAWRSWGGIGGRPVRELHATDGGEAATIAIQVAGAIVSALRQAPGWVVR